MNRIAWFLVFLFGFTVSLSAQSMLAGQSNGEHIHYIDIDDISLSAAYWNAYQLASVDLSDDEVSDLQVYTHWIYYSHPGVLSVIAGTLNSETIELSVMPDHPTWIKKHQAGDVIDKNLFWVSDDAVLYNVYSSKGIDGAFCGDGYLVYRICTSDTLYGWIRLHTDVSFSGSYVTMFDYSFYRSYSGNGAQSDRKDIKYFRRMDNKLGFVFPADEKREGWQLSCYALSGNCVFTLPLDPTTNEIILPDFTSGLYVIVVQHTDGRQFVSKWLY